MRACNASRSKTVNFFKQEQHVAVGPGNGHFIYIHQVSSDAATLSAWPATAAAAAPDTAIDNSLIKNKLLLINQDLT